jgi:thiamine kinase-like enzyme
MKHLGTASSEAEHALEAAICRVSKWKGRQLSYRPVHGGISNTNFCIEVGDDPIQYFVKIPGRGTEMFIDRKAAIAASRQAEKLGIGPRTFDYLDDIDVEIAEFIEGRRPSLHSDFMDQAIRTEAVRTYRCFHKAAPLPLTKTVFDMIDEHIEQVKTLSGHEPEDKLWLFEQYRLARQAFEASGLDLVPSFNDPMPGNFLIGPDKSIVLIDYEYASNNERLYDLAIWSGEMFFSEEIDQEILEAYYGRFDRQLFARFMVLKALADIKWGTWAMVQNRLSALDFDFYKYGIWKHMRARSIINDPRWPFFLKAL